MDSKESRMMVKDGDSDDVKYEFEYPDKWETFYSMKAGYIGDMLQ